MLSKTLTLAAAALLVSALAANAQSSSTPSMQPNPGGATKAEDPGTKGAKTKGAKKKADDPSQSSSTPSMAPTPGAGTTGKIENEGKKTAKVKGKKKQPTPADTSSTPAMAPTK